MTAKNVDYVLEYLSFKYPDAKCDLIFNNPFELLVATVLSAQTTDIQVNKVTPNLFEKYPEPFYLANAYQNDVETVIKSTGFYRRKSKLIINLAQKLLTDFQGIVPNNLNDLVTLPGVGRKTANVVLGNCFNIPGLTIDTHFQRIAHRWNWSKNTDPLKIEKDLMKILPKEKWTKISHQVIRHGRKICKARNPICSECALNVVCPNVQIGLKGA